MSHSSGEPETNGDALEVAVARLTRDAPERAGPAGERERLDREVGQPRARRRPRRQRADDRGGDGETRRAEGRDRSRAPPAYSRSRRAPPSARSQARSMETTPTDLWTRQRPQKAISFCWRSDKCSANRHDVQPPDRRRIRGTNVRPATRTGLRQSRLETRVWEGWRESGSGTR